MRPCLLGMEKEKDASGPINLQHNTDVENIGLTEQADYVTGWKFAAIAVAIVLSMFLV